VNRRTGGSSADQSRGEPCSELNEDTSTIERIPDPAVPDFGAEWDAAWEKNLLAQALERVRGRIDQRHFQIFDFCVTKGWSPAEVAQTLGVSVARIYLIKHRVSALLKKEVRTLEKLANPAFGVAEPQSGRRELSAVLAAPGRVQQTSSPGKPGHQHPSRDV
jgi:DNA-directed RNA polymerase specialized sigma24 family protein